MDAKGSAADLPAQRVGATCTVTEDARDAKGLKQPGSASGGSVSWKDPAAFKVVTNPGHQEKEIASTAVAPTKGNAGGVTFTVPDSTEGAVRIKVVNSVVPHAGIDKTFAKVAKSTEKVNGRTTFDQTYTITVKVTPPALPLVGATAVEASSRSWLPGLVTTLKAAGSFQLTLPPAEVPGCLSPLASRASSVTVQEAPTRWAAGPRRYPWHPP